MAICILQSFFVIFGPLSRAGGSKRSCIVGVAGVLAALRPVVMIALTAGTLFIMWLGEQITEHGIGNGISLIIMAGIIAQLQPALHASLLRRGGTASTPTEMWQTLLMFGGGVGDRRRRGGLHDQGAAPDPDPAGQA